MVSDRFADADLTLDAFLGGRLALWQPTAGYRAGIDPVLLAASVPARPGQSVLDLGCGAGAAALCLDARVKGLTLAGVELQPAYADLARRNAAAAGADFEVVTGDLAALPAPIRARSFDHVLANPPYFDEGAHSDPVDKGRAVARSEVTPLAEWVETAAKRLAPRGYLHLIHRAERLPDLLTSAQRHLGSLEVLPLSARAGRAPELMILRARKSGRAAFRLHHPIILHSGERHIRDGESYTPGIVAVLRDGAALTWG